MEDCPDSFSVDVWLIDYWRDNYYSVVMFYNRGECKYNATIDEKTTFLIPFSSYVRR